MKKFFLLTVFSAVITATLFTACSGGSADPFAASTTSEANVISVEDAFRIIAHENEKTRTLYTKKIVGLGKKAGIGFHEDWEKGDVEAGPLPALFLRGTSNEIQKTNVPLGLYLGSDFPIVKANKFTGVQAAKFETIRKTAEPEFFYDEENQLYTAMFPDFAGAAPCVSCHNDHPNTAKSDWALGDIMGATTWTYPNDSLTMSETLAMIKVYREGVANTYESFLEEVRGFKEKDIPEISDKWSDEGYVVPSKDFFLEAVNEEVGADTFKEIMAFVDNI